MCYNLLNYSTLLVGPVLRYFVPHLVAFSSRPEAASDVVSGVAVEEAGVDVLEIFDCLTF